VLRVAVPNKGSLAEPAADMLRESGYRQRSDPRELVLLDAANDTEFFFLRPRDIATYVGSGELDVGITGRDLLLDSGAPAEEILPLGFAESTFRFAAKPGSASVVADFAGKRVATSYGGLLAKYFADRGVDAEVVRLDGAVETAVRLGVADVIADVVSTGTTLRQAGLEIVGEPILESEAVLVRRSGAADSPAVGQLGAADAGRDHRQAVRADGLRHPGRGRGGGGPAHAGHRVAHGLAAARPRLGRGRAMVPRTETNKIMDELWEIGARGILVTDIHACRL
jgi:ATP phosphoribosyltransferase